MASATYPESSTAASSPPPETPKRGRSQIISRPMAAISVTSTSGIQSGR